MIMFHSKINNMYEIQHTIASIYINSCQVVFTFLPSMIVYMHLFKQEIKHIN